jgi:phenylacetate-CoA ligase
MRESRMLDARLETLDAAARRAYLERRLRETSRRAWGREFGLDDLPALPITRKDALGSMQAANPPFAGLLAGPQNRLQRIFVSPGPTYVPQGPAVDYWRFGMAFAAAGFRAGDIVLNTLSYHLTPGGFMLDSGLRSIGCVVISAGVGQHDLQARTAAALHATGYAGTPSFLRTLLLHARDDKIPLHFESAFATAEMLPESLRAELEGFNIRVLQGYATADLGVLAYECAEKNGMHLQPECIVEILDLETGKSAEPGQPGQVVGTTFDEAYPLLRFATGDVSALMPEGAPCPCGRTAPKLKGLLGRVGDAIKVKGMFVRGSQIDEVMKRFAAVERWQAVITREAHQDRLVYLVEGEVKDLERLAEELRETVKVRGEVQAAARGTIPANAPRLDDRRVWR